MVNVSVAGPSFTFVVVGSSSGDARRYAESLESWISRQGGKDPVEYSTDEDGNVARATLSGKKLFAFSGEKTIELESFFRAVSAVEPNTTVIMTDATWSHAGFPIASDSRSSSGTGYWNLSKQPHPLPPVTGRASIGLVQVTMGVAFFLLMPIGAIILCTLGYRVLRNGQLEVSVRRKRYSKYVMTGTFALLAVHSLIAVATLSTRALEPLAQLWLGLRFTQVAIGVFPISAVFGILPFLFINGLERRYLGRTEQEIAEAVPLPLRPVIVSARAASIQRASKVVVIVGGAILLVGLVMSRGRSDFSTFALLGFPIVTLLNPLVSLRFAGSYQVSDAESRAAILRLTRSVERMSQRLSIPPPPCRVLTDVTRGRYNGLLDSQGLGVTIHTLDEFSDEELDFVVAHELAHKKARHLSWNALLAIVILAPMLLGLAATVVGIPLGLSNPSFILTPMLVTLGLTPVMIFGMPKLRQKQEFEADRLAAAATRDVKTAVIVLRKLALNNGNTVSMDVASTTHPAMAQRIAEVQKLAGV